MLERIDPRRVPASGRPREAAGSYGEDRSAYFTAVADAIRRASLRKPVVAIIEDVHWADSATLELLRFLLQRLGNARVLFLVTLRTEGVARNPGLAALRSTASRSGGEIVALRALRRNEIRHLVQQTLRRQNSLLGSGRDVADRGARRGKSALRRRAGAHRHSERRRAGAAPQHAALAAGHFERTASAVFRSGTRALIRAAIIGQTFDVPLLVAIGGRTSEEVLAVMQRAVDRELLAEADLAPARFRFHHELIRQALADQLVAAVAAPLHVRIAQELETRADARDRAAELAYHWSSARVAEKARVWNEAAAEAAWGVYAYRDAIRFYSAALRWQYPPGPARAAIFERLGTLLYIDGCGEEPATWFTRCRQEYEAAGDATGAARALSCWPISPGWMRKPMKACAPLRKRPRHSTAWDMPRLYGDAILTIARFSITLGNAPQARSHLRAAKRLTAHFDERTRAMLHEVSSETHAYAGNTRAALADFRLAAGLAQQTGMSELIAQVENNFALAALRSGEIDLALERHRIAVDEAHRTDMMWRVAYCSLNYARTLTLKGEFARAQSLTWHAVESGATSATFKTKAAASAYRSR